MLILAVITSGAIKIILARQDREACGVLVLTALAEIFVLMKLRARRKR